jgi:ABC-type Fe3+/spermidine/putrescine transport system ATPase subunit
VSGQPHASVTLPPEKEQINTIKQNYTLFSILKVAKLKWNFHSFFFFNLVPMKRFQQIQCNFTFLLHPIGKGKGEVVSVLNQASHHEEVTCAYLKIIP